MIVSTTLAGPGAEASIVDALRSCAGFVDQHLILVASANAELVAGALRAAGFSPLDTRWRIYEWPGNYGEARNAALAFAREEGATWAATVDVDERLELDAGHVRAALKAAGDRLDMLAVSDRDLGYQKPRFIRCASDLYWKGEVHERLSYRPERSGYMAGRFWELPKTPEQERRRFERGVDACARELALEDDLHTRRHYAECLLGVGRENEALEQYFLLDARSDLPQYERSWVTYRIAERLIIAGELDSAKQRAALQLANDPGFIQEFGWLLAHIAAQQKRPHDAALWAEYALGAPVDEGRAGHRSPTWRKGCEDLLARAQASQGMYRTEDFAERQAFAEDYAILARALNEALGFPQHCLDLGAGNGLLVAALRREGIPTWGVEESSTAPEATDEGIRKFISFGVPLDRWHSIEEFGAACTWDLVSCVEVGEHVPESRADELVDACCAQSRRWIYFSAAHPGQGGHGHVNEQPPAYWAQKFEARGWELDHTVTAELVDSLTGLSQCWWLQRNAQVFRKL